MIFSTYLKYIKLTIGINAAIQHQMLPLYLLRIARLIINETANNIYERNIRIAGKTGTAQVKSIGETEYKLLREDKSLRDHALFVGYGPVENPKLVVVAIIENGESGSAVAAPIVRKAINLYSKNEK